MIIDFHVHAFPDAVAEKAIPELAVRSGLIPHTDGTISGTKEKFEEFGIDDFVVLSIATNPRQQKKVNDFAIELIGRRTMAFGSVHPAAEDVREEILRIKKAGVLGIKLHPVYQGFDIDDKSAYPIYECCEALGLPICFHAGVDIGFPDDRSAMPEASSKVVRDFPNLKVVFAHLGGYKAWDEVYTCLAGRGKDVYFDTAAINWTIDPDFAVKIIKKHGAERVLLGSDCPWENPRTAARFVESLSLSDDEKELILSRNAKRLLNV